MITRTLRHPGTPACLDVVQDALAALWEEAPEVVDGDRMSFEIALVEIVGNLVEHARRPDGRPVDVRMHIAVHGDRLEARMEDDGAPAGVDPTATALPTDELAESGRGLALAAAVADLEHVRRTAGNVWTVVRRRT
ncbi:ATP-binding protein [Pseudonocardia kujensis]|uniref:ATP-binding protein n=1 Tax=Pseudonocardia kujensis TaxID=1128675 RepID=UPI001E35EA6F|nr:ATP-binding protein [Pseudonocardia kujensis]MCE0767044.1 ATP-binding protein [Pseudonocardia kujensis]